MAPKPDFKQFVGFLHVENEEVVEIKDMPLLFIQLTQLGCRGVAFASRYNHCVLDGVAVREFQANVAALTLGKLMVLIPNPDRTVFRAWKQPHHEYSKPIHCKSNATFVQSSIYDRAHLIHLIITTPHCQLKESHREGWENVKLHHLPSRGSKDIEGKERCFGNGGRKDFNNVVSHGL